MRRKVLYLIVVVLSVVSCGKDYFGEGTISFSAVNAGPTRAMMDSTALNSTGNKLRVFDVLTGFSGNVSWMSAENPYYINDSLVFAGSPVWNYGSSRTYPWTADGTHKFFSWLHYDNTLGMYEEEFFGAGTSYNASTQVLTIPQKVMDASTPLFDFMYSDVITVPAQTHKANTPISLKHHHLFTAMNLEVQNTSGNTVYLKRVTLVGMKNKRSATIDYSAATVQVATANIDSVSTVLFQSADPAGSVYINQETILNLTDYILMWPQTYMELDTNARLVVEYNVLDNNDNLSADLTASVVLSRQKFFKDNFVGMDAGTKYSLMLQFKRSSIEIYTRVLPWEYEAYDWDYSDHSISARSGMFKDGVLAFYRYNSTTESYSTEPTTEEWSAKTMRFRTNTEVMKGRFYIEAPTSGRWQITAYPLSAAQYFEIEPTSGEIDAFTENGKVEFTVKPNNDLSPTTTQTLFFNVAIYFNGEWHDANSEFNRKNIRLVLDAN
ncbi:MAG: hypothetical protein IJS91_06990 [Bacteroidales bacterium]|nr:hypothetical protein [Bacteroidales bacterium]